MAVFHGAHFFSDRPHTITPKSVSGNVKVSPAGAKPGKGTDIIHSQHGDDYLDGGGGHDFIYAYGGIDQLFGRGGSDLLDGGTGADYMVGGKGDDTFLVENVGDIVEEIQGEGTDTVLSSIDYKIGRAVENLELTGTALKGTGNNQPNEISGNVSANMLFGAGGGDVLSGFGGDDILNGNKGKDWLYGNQGNDRLFGDEGKDRLYGGSGKDELFGDKGNDQLFGGKGDDRLDGGLGANKLIGGRGDDRFIFDEEAIYERNSVDVIKGFDGAGRFNGDRIDLSDVDAIARSSGNQAFKFGASKKKGHLWAVDEGKKTVILGNTDNDKKAEVWIVIKDGDVEASDYYSGDFIL